MKKLKVLMIEDDEPVRSMMQDILQGTGSYEVLAVSNAPQGIECYVQFDPDIIVTDLGMQVMDGCELIKAIRYTNPSIPILVVTGMASMVSSAMNCGANELLTKPFVEKDLVKALGQIKMPH